MKKANNNIEFVYTKFESVDPPVTSIDRRGNFVKYNDDNLYPQFLASLTLQSPTHSAFIELIGKSIAGLGVDIINPKTGEIWQEAQASFNEWNEYDIDDTQVEKMSLDLAKYNGLSLSAEWNNAKILTDTAKITGGQTPADTMLNQGAVFSYTAFKDWRSGAPDADGDVHSYFFSKEWHKANPNYTEYGAFNPDTVVYGDAEDLTKEEMQLLYYYRKNDNSDVYPIPSYLSSIYQILSEGVLAKTNYNSIINAFQPDGILVVPFMADSEEGKQKLENDFRNNYTGAENTRKVIVMQTDGGVDTQQPTWIPINSTDNPEMRVALAAQFSQDISTAHGSTSPSLVGIKGSTGLTSDANELIMAYNIFYMKTIQSYQKTIERIINRYVIKYGAKEFKTAKAQIKPLNFHELLGLIESNGN